MRVAVAVTDRRRRFPRNLTRWLALIGVLHFALSLVIWSLFYVGSHRRGWSSVFTFSYATRHVGPAVFLLALFGCASAAGWRGRRSALPLLAFGLLLSVGTFVADLRERPQFERVWTDEPGLCTNRQTYYCTWWWWQPKRH